MEKPHSHNYYELFIMLEGEVRYRIGEKLFFPAATQIMILPPNTSHCFTVSSNIDNHPFFRGIHVYFHLTLHESNQFFSDIFDKVQCIDVSNYPEIITLIHTTLHYHHWMSNEEFEFVQSGLINQLAMLLYKYLFIGVPHTQRSIHHTTVHVLAYINQHLTERLSVASLAHAFRFKESYISTLFKNDMGISIFSYIQQRRIRLAHTLIFGGEKPTQAMYKSGFTDYPNFYRLFLKEYGVSPRDMYNKYRLESTMLPDKQWREDLSILEDKKKHE